MKKEDVLIFVKKTIYININIMGYASKNALIIQTTKKMNLHVKM